MKDYLRQAGILILMLFMLFSGVYLGKRDSVSAAAPTIQTTDTWLRGQTQTYQDALYQATRIYSKMPACTSYDLAADTARYAVAVDIPANVVAAEVEVESSCNPLAVSNRGAVGIAQVLPSAWSKEYDFSSLNLFNQSTNLQIATEILSSQVKQHGLRGGLEHYFGISPGSSAAAQYANKVLALAGERQ